MRVLIISDTHGRHAGIEEAIQREFPFQRLIHLGDAEGYEDYIADLAEFSDGLKESVDLLLHRQQVDG